MGNNEQRGVSLMNIDKVQLEADYEAFMKALKETPEKFPDTSFGISRIQRALKLGYNRASYLQDLAIERGVLKRIKHPYKVILVRNALNAK